MRLINKVDVREHTNTQFIKSHELKFEDLTDFNMSVVKFKARNIVVLENLQRLFIFRSNNEDQRRKFNFESLCACKTLKQTCISVYGVKLWNSLSND